MTPEKSLNSEVKLAARQAPLTFRALEIPESP